MMSGTQSEASESVSVVVVAAVARTLAGRNAFGGQKSGDKEFS